MSTIVLSSVSQVSLFTKLQFAITTVIRKRWRSVNENPAVSPSFVGFYHLYLFYLSVML